MIERPMERFDCDSAYGSADMLNWLVHAVGSSPTATPSACHFGLPGARLLRRC